MKDLEPIVEQFNNFSTGITSELRTKYENPKFAKLWNFDVSQSRAIQHGGLTKLVSDEGFFVKKNNANLAQRGSQVQNWDLNNFGYLITFDLKIYEINGMTSTHIESIAGTLSQSIIPIMYNGLLIFGMDDGSLWSYDFYGGVDELFVGEMFYPNTFLTVGVDNVLYIMSGSQVHRWEHVNGNSNFSNNNQLAPYQPITEYMQEGDRNGVKGTYTGLLGPEIQTIDNIDEVQSILSILGYYDGPIDGMFGGLTKDAITAFQTEYNATGQYQSIGGQSLGQPLVQDGIVGPETQSVLNLPDHNKKTNTRSRLNILDIYYEITAVTAYGGYIAIAVNDMENGASVYLWDMSLDKNGQGDIGLITKAIVGQGVIQALNVLEGKLIAIMTPTNQTSNAHKYNRLMFYEVQAGFDMLPHSRASLLRELRLLTSDYTGELPNLQKTDNYINQRTEIFGSRLYFSGRLHIQHTESGTHDEGVMSGIFSIDRNGNINPEVMESSSGDETDIDVISFGIFAGGFLLSGGGDTYITDVDGGDQESGFVTSIISGGQPWRSKQIENIFLALDDTEDLDEVRIYTREVMDKTDSDAGWTKIYDGDTSNEKRSFNNRIHLQRNKVTGKNFSNFRELQVMVIIEGKSVELVDLTVVYNLLNMNK